MYSTIFAFLKIQSWAYSVPLPPELTLVSARLNHSSSVAATELEISKVGKSKESFARLSHPTRTAPARAPGQKGQGSGNRPLHKSSGGRGHSSQSVSHTVSEKAESTSFKTDEVGHDDGQSRQSVSSKVGRRNR